MCTVSTYTLLLESNTGMNVWCYSYFCLTIIKSVDRIVYNMWNTFKAVKKTFKINIMLYLYMIHLFYIIVNNIFYSVIQLNYSINICYT